jgi:hypothetical protein
MPGKRSLPLSGLSRYKETGRPQLRSAHPEAHLVDFIASVPHRRHSRPCGDSTVARPTSHAHAVALPSGPSPRRNGCRPSGNTRESIRDHGLAAHRGARPRHAVGRLVRRHPQPVRLRFQGRTRRACLQQFFAYHFSSAAGKCKCRAVATRNNYKSAIAMNARIRSAPPSVVGSWCLAGFQRRGRNLVPPSFAPLQPGSLRTRVASALHPAVRHSPTT